MGCAEKVVLAYSGGVDASVCIPYPKDEWEVKEVITLGADLSQGDELEPIRKKALNLGECFALKSLSSEDRVNQAISLMHNFVHCISLTYDG